MPDGKVASITASEIEVIFKRDFAHDPYSAIERAESFISTLKGFARFLSEIKILIGSNKTGKI